MARNQNYKADLIADLRANPTFAAEYITAAYNDSQEAFLVALRDVAEARVGIAKVARGTKLNRESLYRTLSREGNPRLNTLNLILEEIGMEVKIKPRMIANAPNNPHPGLTATATSLITTVEGTSNSQIAARSAKSSDSLQLLAGTSNNHNLAIAA